MKDYASGVKSYHRCHWNVPCNAI